MTRKRKFFSFSLILLSLSVPFYRFEIPEIDLAVPTVIVFVIFVVWILSAFIRREHNVSSGKFFVLIIVGSLYISLGLSTFTSPITRPEALSELISFAARVLFFLVPFVLIDTLSRLRLALVLYFIGGLIVAIGIILVGSQIITTDFARTDDLRWSFAGGNFVRTSGIITNFGDISIYFSMMLVALIMGFVTRNRSLVLRFAIIIVALALIVGGQYFAQSRNVLVTNILVVSLMFIFPRSTRRHRNLLIISGVSLAGALILMYYLVYHETIHEYFLTIEGLGRLTQYRLAWQGLSNGNWLIGNGIGAFEKVYGYPYDIHNMVVQILYWGGFIGAFIWLGIIIVPFFRMTLLGNKYYFEIEKIFQIYYYFIFVVLAAGTFFPALSSIIYWFSLGVLSSIPYIRELDPKHRNGNRYGRSLVVT